VGTDEKLAKNICVTIIATGFKTKNQIKKEKPVEKVVHKLMDYVTPPVKKKKPDPAPEIMNEPFLINGEITEDVTEEKIVEEDQVYEAEIPEPVFISPMPVEDEFEEEILPIDF